MVFGNKGSNWCTGYNPPRFVHKSVCQWHLAKEDTKCSDCLISKGEKTMPLIAKQGNVSGGGGRGEPLSPGLHHGICFAIYDLGTQYSEKWKSTARKVCLMFEVPAERIEIDGANLPKATSRMFTLSLHPKSLLRGVLESWRGQAFTDAELEGFDIMKLLGVNAQLQVMMDATGKYANINNILPWTGEAKVTENPHKFFSFDDGKPIPEGIPEWILKFMHKSEEYRSSRQAIEDLPADIKPDDSPIEGGSKPPF